MLKRFIVLFPAAYAAAQMVLPPNAAWAESSYMLDDVVVTAGRISERKKEVSANITVISREEIYQSAAGNVADLLAEKNIGHIQKYPGNLTSVGIRGFRTDTLGNDLQGHVLVLLDGRRAGSGNLSKFLTKNIERIEVIRGPGAVQYGSAGMGGVVNIITRRGKENSLFTEAGGGSFETYEGSIGGELNTNNFDFAGALTSSTQGDYTTGDGDTYHNTGVDSETGVSANLGYSLTETQRLGVIVTSFDVNESGSPEYLSQNDLDDYSDKSNHSVDFSYSGSCSDDSCQWLARYFFGRDDNTWHDPTASNPSFWDDGIKDTNKTDQMGGQLQATGAFDLATITIGFDWVSYDVENSYSPTSTEYDNPALLLLGKTRILNQRLTVNYGLRQDWYQVSVNDSEGNDEDENRLTPMVGIAYQLTDHVKLRTQYAQGFVMPSADQLAADYSMWGMHVVGNAALDPEKSSTYEGGVDVNREGFEGSLTYFHTKYENMIVVGSLPGGAKTWVNENGDTTIAGFEAGISYDIGALMHWQWEVRPYLNMTVLTDYENDAGDALKYTSETTLSSGLVVDNGSGMFCRLHATYNSSQDVDDWESGIWPAPVADLDSFVVVDLSAGWKFYESDRLGSLSLRGDITNLLDEDYAYVKGYPMPGRGLFVRLRWDY